jgi:hypothetical protein
MLFFCNQGEVRAQQGRPLPGFPVTHEDVLPGLLSCRGRRPSCAGMIMGP